MKIKTIVIVVVVCVIAYVAYKHFTKPNIAEDQIKNSVIPDEVQKYLRDFSEGETFAYGGKSYTVINGEWAEK